MHVVAFNGSPRKNGNTARLVRHCLDTLESEGISTAVSYTHLTLPTKA